MAHHSTYKGIEFICEEGVLSGLHAWYDNLRENDVKNSATKVKCSMYRPYDQAGFRVIVLCNHPFSKSVLTLNVDHDTLIDCRLEALAPEFTAWIDRNNMPAETLIGNRYACIDWWPVELAAHFFNDMSAQGQARWEMESHHLDCLELIRLAVISDQEFAELWRDSNEPFFAAGRLIIGEFQWIREVPFHYLRGEASNEMLTERVGEYSREFVGLMRLASSVEADSLLLDRVSAVIRSFKAEHSKEVPQWLDVAREFLDGANEVPIGLAYQTAEFTKIDEACDRLRGDLVNATRGLQEEIIALINAVLPVLDVPLSSVSFAEEDDRQFT